MGIIFCYQSRAELIREETSSGDNEELTYQTLEYAVRQELDCDILWSAIEVVAKVDGLPWDGLGNAGDRIVFIRCGLIEHDQGRWGCKHIDEDFVPVYHSCPHTVLNRATAPRSEPVALWRARVRQYRAPARLDPLAFVGI